MPDSAANIIADRDALEEVVTAVAGIDPVNWPARTFITSLLWRARERQPVADSLDGPLPH